MARQKQQQRAAHPGAGEAVGKHDKLLRRIYYDAEGVGSYGSAAKLYKEAKRVQKRIKLDDVKDWLAAQPAYTLHKPYRKRFSRNKTIVHGIDSQWQVDLADLPRQVEHNDGYRYILTCIDVFSRYAWAVPIRTKSAPDVHAAFVTLFRKAAPRVPQRIQSDDGKEFVNIKVKQLFQEKGIEHFVTASEHKAALVERFNETLKNKLKRYATAHNTYRYLRVLDMLVRGYNRDEHRMIAMAPADVTHGKEADLWVHQYAHAMARAPDAARKPLPEDQVVRLSKVKGTFEKGDTANWTEEYFKVKKRQHAPGGRDTYKIVDWAGEPIKGQFYEEEIQRIKPSDLFVVERVIKRRTYRGKKQVYVKWRGAPDKFNQWIDATEIVQLEQGDG